MLKSTLDRIVRSHRNVTSSCSISISISSISGVPKEKVDCVVIGADVVGLAVARELALKGREVLVLDSAPTFSTSTSSRNSEVIHAGIYYPTHSLKPKFCVRGRYLLYKYCSHHNITHKQIGKLIVATGSSEIPDLHNLMHCGIQNGVDGLVMIWRVQKP